MWLYYISQTLYYVYVLEKCLQQPPVEFSPYGQWAAERPQVATSHTQLPQGWHGCVCGLGRPGTGAAEVGQIRNGQVGAKGTLARVHTQQDPL